MPDPESRDPQPDLRELALAVWKGRLDDLVGTVKKWVERDGWRTRTIEKPVNDRVLGRHMVPVLLMEKDTLEVALNPVSPSMEEAGGAVDLYLVPSYDDVASLYFEGGRWVIHYEFEPNSQGSHSLGQVESLPLSEESMIRVLTSFCSHVA